VITLLKVKGYEIVTVYAVVAGTVHSSVAAVIPGGVGDVASPPKAKAAV
jgi:hypothetical protein